MNFQAAILFASILVLCTAQLACADDDTKLWLDRISFRGDLRLRHEVVDEEGESSRNRGRYRARLGMSADVHPDVKVIMQIASGADDPVSRNVTFDGGFTTKDIGFDLAYVDWAAAEGLHVYGGKMKNPLYKAGGAALIWDSDLNPEGFAANYSKGRFFATLAGFSVEERSASDDSLLYAVQVGGKFNVGKNAKLTVGVGYFGYTDTIGNEPFFDGRSKGNSVDLNGNYLHEYKDTELFGQLDTKVGDWPVSIYAQWVRNSEVSEEDTGYAFGAKIGSAKSKGQKQFSWTYQDIEADAVIGTFNESDFGGGGTDSSGHILKGRYAVSRAIVLGANFFFNEIDRFQGSEHDYKRFQLDIEFKFN